MPKPTWLHRLAAAIAASYLHLVGLTSFVEMWDHPSYLPYRRKKKSIIYGFWHNAQVFLAYHHRGEPVSIMVSKSQDGEYIAQVMRWMGLNPVRGSTTRGGKQAFLELMEHLERKEQVGFTPDGPRGPVYSVQDGIVMAAQKSGVPVVAAHAFPRRRLTFNSWDKFMVPLPFGHIIVSHGRPIVLEENIPEETAREKVRTLLNENKEECRHVEKAAPTYGQSLCGLFLLAIYNLLSPVFLLLGLPFFAKKYGLKKFKSGVLERLGFSKPNRPAEKRFWFHAASVGEWQAVKSWLDQVTKDAEILITTSAPEARDVIRKEQPDARVHLLPLDLPWIISPWIRRWSPDAVFIMETEIWPNMIEACSKQFIPIFVVNGRLSEKGLKKRLWARPLLARLLRRISKIYARTPDDAARYAALGAPAERVEAIGNLKIDNLSIVTAEEKKKKRRTLWNEAPGVIVVAGSTWGKEEELVLKFLNEPGCEEARLVIVPRRLKRFDEVARLIEEKSFSFDRWSKIKNGGSWSKRVLLVDTIGDLKKMYDAADVAFIGGSFEARGGQNPLEAAAAANALVFGSSMENFSFEAQQLIHGGAAFQRKDEAGLLTALSKLVKDASLRHSMGAAAAGVVVKNQGASKKIMQSLKEQLDI